MCIYLKTSFLLLWFGLILSSSLVLLSNDFLKLPCIVSLGLFSRTLSSYLQKNTKDIILLRLCMLEKLFILLSPSVDTWLGATHCLLSFRVAVEMPKCHSTCLPSSCLLSSLETFRILLYLVAEYLSVVCLSVTLILYYADWIFTDSFNLEVFLYYFFANFIVTAYSVFSR